MTPNMKILNNRIVIFVCKNALINERFSLKHSAVLFKKKKRSNYERTGGRRGGGAN